MSKQSDLVGFTQGSVKLTVDANSTEEDVVLIQDSNDVDVASLRINNGAFIVKGKNASQPVQLQTHDGNEDIEVDPDGFIKMETAGAERLRIDSSGNVGIGTSSPTGELTLYKASGSLALDITRGSNRWTIGEYDNNNLIQIGGLYGVHPGIQINTSGYLRCQGVYNDSAADSANVVVDGSGNIYRSTSALKYKQDIRDIEEIDISQFRPVRYKSNLERDDQTKDHFGFIADEAHDAGYTELVSYGVPDEETGVAEVEGFRYDRMTVLLTKVIQQQQATIDALEARVAALETV